MKDTLITNGTLYLEEGPRRADLLVSNGRISEIGQLAGRREADERIDAAGLCVLPGLFDFHVHLSEQIGDFALADSFYTGSQTAIRTGITTILSFVTQKPNQSLDDAFEAQMAKARGQTFCDYGFHVTPNRFDEQGWQDIVRVTSDGPRTLKLYTTYKEAGLFTDYVELAQIMRRAADLDLTLLIHCEDQSVIDNVEIEEDALAMASSQIEMRPEQAEVEAIRKVVQLAEQTRCRVHIVHVSTPEGAALIRNASEGAKITCETAPHYFALNAEKVRGPYGHRYLCSPPLRENRTRKQIEKLLTEGVFDLVATDHCAFTTEDKDAFAGDARRVPRGLPGIGALVPLTYDYLVGRNQRSLSELVERLALRPAMLSGLFPRKGVIRPGSDADLVLVDTAGTVKQVTASEQSVYDPYSGMATTWDVQLVMLRGVPVVRGGSILKPLEPSGEYPWTRKSLMPGAMMQSPK